MSVVLVDWLGRGGIAQCTEAWAIELDRAGRHVTVVTRPNRPLSEGRLTTEVGIGCGGRFRSHAEVASTAAGVIRDEHPDAVVVQNYVLPALERALYRAVDEVGCRLVVVVHDDQLHSAAAGTRAGLRRHLRRADQVVAHTSYVADRVAQWAGRTVEVIPHPLQLGMLAYPQEGWPFECRPTDLVALHFGILRRRYKGSDTAVGLSDEGVPQWQFAFIGVGAPSPRPGRFSEGSFVSDEALVRAVRASSAVLLPYRRATQSGAVVLAQALGTVVVASAVGGIPEQILNGRTGLLIPAGAPVSRWAAALEQLSDPLVRHDISAAARSAVLGQHDLFRSSILEMLA